MYRGREMVHREIGRKQLDRVVELLGTIAAVESLPRMEGRLLSMILVPNREVIEQMARQEKAAAKAAAKLRPKRMPPNRDGGGPRRTASRPRARRESDDDAQDEDPPRRCQALQEDRHGQDRALARPTSVTSSPRSRASGSDACASPRWSTSDSQPPGADAPQSLSDARVRGQRSRVMARVKRGVAAKKRAQAHPRRGEGLLRRARTPAQERARGRRSAAGGTPIATASSASASSASSGSCASTRRRASTASPTAG